MKKKSDLIFLFVLALLVLLLQIGFMHKQQSKEPRTVEQQIHEESMVQ
jgi:regulatory protein YycI of two-component signal transduction system YycFG